MSHIVEIKTEVRDATAVRAACQRLKLPQPIEGTHRLYSGEVRGFGVQLADWRYPVVCDLATGQLQFDNFNGRWGDPEKLGRLLQMYAVENSSRPQCTPFNGFVGCDLLGLAWFGFIYGQYSGVGVLAPVADPVMLLRTLAGRRAMKPVGGVSSGSSGKEVLLLGCPEASTSF